MIDEKYVDEKAEELHDELCGHICDKQSCVWIRAFKRIIRTVVEDCKLKVSEKFVEELGKKLKYRHFDKRMSENYYPKKLIEDKLAHLLSVIELKKGDKAVEDALQVEISQYRNALHLIESQAEPKVQDLGWANGWSEDPQIVKDCRKAEHKTTETNRDPSWHGLHTEVRCDICGYVYHYDSSG